jgi:hypothetical protein
MRYLRWIAHMMLCNVCIYLLRTLMHIFFTFSHTFVGNILYEAFTNTSTIQINSPFKHTGRKCTRLMHL